MLIRMTNKATFVLSKGTDPVTSPFCPFTITKFKVWIEVQVNNMDCSYCSSGRYSSFLISICNAKIEGFPIRVTIDNKYFFLHDVVLHYKNTDRATVFIGQMSKKKFRCEYDLNDVV